MNYEEALQYIGSRLRFGIKPGLERTRSLLTRLGKPQDSLRFIHVAGTNGKGSVCTMTAAALIEAGYKTGLYTSPYITDFRERMQIDSQMIPRDELAKLTGEVAAHIGVDEQITEFELITCIAMLWFSRQKCDYVVLETGLGGRFDATNVIDNPVCTAITKIDYDHTAILGDTLSAIAGEKAGIMKKGVPVVIEPSQHSESDIVLETAAAALDCPLIHPDISSVTVKSCDLFGTDISYRGMNIHIPLVGRHQINNALTAIEILRVIGLEEKYIIDGIAKTHIPARLEVLSSSPLVILDGAHNPNGAMALCDVIDEMLGGYRIRAVMGVLRDKDYRTELSMLGERFEKIYACDGFSERVLPAEEFAQTAAEVTSVQPTASPQEALQSALRETDEKTAIVICGSLYLAGAIRGYAIDLLNN